MNKRSALLGALVLSCVVGAGDSALPQTSSTNSPNEAPAAYTMTMGDLMNTLIQPRHAKLGLAGRAQNWALAGYAIVEIRQVFAGIVKAVPKFHGLPVAQLVDAALSQPMDAVDAAIKQRDPKEFDAAYAQLTQGCNACHTALDHPFVVIKVPDASTFPNQDFNPHP